MHEMFTPSDDWRSMVKYWQAVEDIADGVEAMRNRPKRYLPQFPMESNDSWEYRNQISRLVALASDIIEGLASKPFSREAYLVDGTFSDRMKAVAEDVTAEGDHLSVFASMVMHRGIADAISWVLVDYSGTGQAENALQERQEAIRPYLLRIDAKDMIHATSAIRGGVERFTDVRILETPDRVRRIQHLDPAGPPVVEVWEKSGGSAVLVSSHPLGFPFIPLLPFVTGYKRPGSWRVTPPMKRMIDLQIEHYQESTNLKLAKQVVGSPMLVGAGVAPPVDEEGKPVKLTTGPNTVLYAPPNDQGQHGTWSMLTIDAAGLKFLADQIDATEAQMRELGRQPLSAGTAGITSVAAAFASQKASSTLQSWTLALKDVLETALLYAAQWMGLPDEPKVSLYTDFAINIGDDKAPDLLYQMAKPDENGERFISRRTLYREMQRRGILSDEFDADQESQRLADEFDFEMETEE